MHKRNPLKQIMFLVLGLLACGTVIVQFYIMMQNRVAPVTETSIRFFSYFTILTNSLAGIYALLQSFRKNTGDDLMAAEKGMFTAITVYITIVGLVYQVLLRQTWHPRGIQKIVDELLHSVIPLLCIIYWYVFENKERLHYRLIKSWLIYPFLYLIFVLWRGHYSHFYPYPFLDVNELGFTNVMIHSFLIFMLFLVVALVYLAIGKQVTAKR